MKGVNSLAGEHLLPCVSWHCPDAPLLHSRFPLGYVFLMGDCGAGADDAPPRVHENVPFSISASNQALALHRKRVARFHVWPLTLGDANRYSLLGRFFSANRNQSLYDATLNGEVMFWPPVSHHNRTFAPGTFRTT